MVEFGRLDAIRIAAVLDDQDAGGPAALDDLERLAAVTSAGLVRRDGAFTWVSGAEAEVVDPAHTVERMTAIGTTFATV